MIHLLTIFNITFSFFLWLPTWTKILKRKCAKDYSLLSFGMIETLQVSGLLLAMLKHTWPFILYYLANTLVVAITIGMIWWFQKEKPIEFGKTRHNCKEAGCWVG